MSYNYTAGRLMRRATIAESLQRRRTEHCELETVESGHEEQRTVCVCACESSITLRLTRLRTTSRNRDRVPRRAARDH